MSDNINPIARRMLPDLQRELETYRWQTNDGQSLRPIVMRTGHLYNTVAMLWHHTMPPAAHIYPHRRYRLSARFTRDFIILSIRILLAELSSRADVNDYQRGNIMKMMNYLKKNPEKLGRKSISLEA